MSIRDRYFNRRTFTRAIAGMGIAPVLYGSAARAAATDDGDTTVIRYLNSHGGVESFEMANALGYFQGTNIQIASQGYSAGGPESLVAMASGAVDIAGSATPAIINAIAAGQEIIGVFPNGGIDQTVNSKFFVLADSPIRAPRDLAGASIAVNILGAALDYTTREYLRQAGLKPEIVKLITVPGPQLEQVLRHKQADVVSVGAWQAVFAGKIQADGGARVLFTDYDVLGAIVLGSYAMKKSFIAKHRLAVGQFVTAAARAVNWSQANPQAAKQLVAKLLAGRGDNPAVAQYWPGYGLRPNGAYVPHDAQFWIDTLVRGGRLEPGQLTPADVETNKFNALVTNS